MGRMVRFTNVRKGAVQDCITGPDNSTQAVGGALDEGRVLVNYGLPLCVVCIQGTGGFVCDMYTCYICAWLMREAGGMATRIIGYTNVKPLKPELRAGWVYRALTTDLCRDYEWKGPARRPCQTLTVITKASKSLLQSRRGVFNLLASLCQSYSPWLKFLKPQFPTTSSHLPFFCLHKS